MSTEEESVVAEVPTSVSSLSTAGKRAYELIKLDAVIKACLPVTELETRTKKELRILVNKNFKNIVKKVDFKVICPIVDCDVPPEADHGLIKKILLTRIIESEDCAKVSRYF